MKHHLTETQEHNIELHNIVLSSQSISLSIVSERNYGILT